MIKNLSNKLKAFTLAVFSFGLMQFPVYAENKIDWRVDGDIAGQYNSNLAQLKDFPGDFINTYTATGTLRYLAPTQTQVLARLQGQYNKFINYRDFDVLVFAGSLTVSQWLFNSLNIYAGVQPIQLVSTVNDRRPLDMVYMGGLTYFYPFGTELAYGGYQFDRLQASAADYRAFNHTFLLGFRHPFTSNFVGNIGAKVRLRNLDTSPDDTRFIGNLSAQYLLTQWLTLQVTGDYTYVNSASPDKTVGFFNVGVNIIGGYNNSLTF